MHNIRRKAKYEAWYGDADGKNSLVRNPFQKYKAPNSSRRNTIDNAEKGNNKPDLSKVATDDYDNRSSSALERRQDLRGPSPPAHASTLPNVNSRMGQDSNKPKQHSSDPIQEDSEKIVEEPEAFAGKDSHSSATVAGEEGKHEEAGKHSSHMLEKLHLRKPDNTDSEMNGNHEEGHEADDDNNGKDKAPQKKFTFMSQVHATILNSWINVLLIASPVGIAVYYAHVTPIAVFVINFIAIIPLAGMLSYATEEIALRVGETLGGLLNASFGNAVELIVSIIALVQHQVLIVQTSLIGSILSNLLLVMGMCFFFGGINRVEQAFNMTVAQTASSLLFLAVSALIIPTAFDQWATTGNGQTATRVRELSRGTAILLLIVYGCYLFFQLKSHAAMYNQTSEKNPKRDLSKHTDKFKNNFRKVKHPRHGKAAAEESGSRPDTPEEDKDEPEEPQLHIWVAIGTLAASTVLVALNAEYLVDSINEVTCDYGINKNFVGLILLPIVGNAAEHATAVTVAVKDKMDLAIGVAVGSSMQIALLVLPFTVVLGWIMGRPGMTLEFDGFQIAVLFVAVLLVNYLIQDGKSHWLEGVLLQTLYIIIAVAAWFYPASKDLNQC